MSINKKKITSILIVCTGNSCRSIMVEGYLSKRLKEKGINIQVASAGTIAMGGTAPLNETIAVMKEEGIDVSNYRSNALQKDAVKAADLILIMEPMHEDAVLKAGPSMEDKIFYLREFAEGELSGKYIPDPIGKPREVYRDTLDIIKESAEGFLKWLEN